jgi:hypothetical protein
MLGDACLERPMLSLPGVNIEIGLDGSFKVLSHCIAIGEAELVVHGVQETQELVAFAEHEDQAFGLEADQSTVGKPGLEVVVPRLVTVLATKQ